MEHSASSGKKDMEEMKEMLQTIMEKCNYMERRMMQQEGGWQDMARQMKDQLQTLNVGEDETWKNWLSQNLTNEMQSFGAALERAGEKLPKLK